MDYDYEQYYFARELAGNLGLGRIWFLKAPKENDPEFDGGKFLGSLIRYVDDSAPRVHIMEYENPNPPLKMGIS